MKTQIENFKDVVEQGGFYRTGHPIKTFLKFLAQSNSVQELTDKISLWYMDRGYVSMFADKMAI